MGQTKMRRTNIRRPSSITKRRGATPAGRISRTPSTGDGAARIARNAPRRCPDPNSPCIARTRARIRLAGRSEVRRWLHAQATLLWAGLSVLGCAGEDLAARVDDVRQQLEQARTRGAYRCAPRQLAI